MVNFKHFLSLVFTEKFFKKFFAYFFLILVIYLFSDFVFILFLTFVFAYLFYSVSDVVKQKIDFVLDKYCRNNSRRNIIKKLFGLNLLIIISYLLFVSVIFLVLSGLLPKLINELTDITKNIPILSEQTAYITETLKEIRQNYSEIGGTLSQVFSNQDFDVLVDVFDSIKNVGIIFFKIIVSLILSFVFLIDRKKLNKYLFGIKESSFSFVYEEYTIIFEKIVKSFGLILKAQAVIASVNAILTVFGLYLIGLFYGMIFPYILTLGLVVFIFGFVPVLGTFISSVPILFIAFSFVGGLQAAVAVLLLIIIIHTIEAYFLNPKIVSSILDFPVSLTFLILLVSEHVFGFAGLLIGVSLFYFLIELLKDVDKAIIKNKKNRKKQLKEISKFKDVLHEKNKEA